MRHRNFLLVREMVVGFGIFGGVVILVLVLGFIRQKTFIAAEVIVIVGIALLMQQLDRYFVYKRHKVEQDSLLSDIEIKDILYDLLQKTAANEENQDLYHEILGAAIKAIPKSSKGTIIDIRNPKRVVYVAVEGFDTLVLEKMKLSLQDTYLYKETGGSLDHTVIVKDSVNYNRLHSNDDYVQDLIEAGTVGIRSTLCTPIRTNGQVIGMINIDSVKKNAFTNKDIELLEMFALEVGKMIQYFETMKENKYLSQYDAMTMIYNRGYFYEKHKELYATIKDQSYIFIATDIDNLKKVNDTYGHDAGDRFICHFVNMVKSHLDDEAIFGRYGGDEFNILLQGATYEAASELMQKITKALMTDPLEYLDKKIYVSYSYGIAKYPEDERDYNQLIIKADQLMYEHKKSKVNKNEQEGKL